MKDKKNVLKGSAIDAEPDLLMKDLVCILQVLQLVN